MLDNLKGLHESRDVKKPEMSENVWIMKDIEKMIIESSKGTEYGSSTKDRVYTMMDSLSMSGSDIEEYIRVSASLDVSEPLKMLRGVITSAALSCVPDKQVLHINTEGNCFDYLFRYAGFPGTLIIENASGDYMCDHIGVTRDFNKVVLVNCSGNFMLNSAGSSFYTTDGEEMSGALNTVIMVNCRSASYGLGVSSANYVIGINLRGWQTMRGCPTYMGKLFIDCDSKKELLGSIPVTRHGMMADFDEKKLVAEDRSGGLQYELCNNIEDSEIYRSLKLKDLKMLADEAKQSEARRISVLAARMVEIMKGWK